VACDTSKDDQVKAFQQAFSTWSGGAPPSLLICNAAVVNKPRPLWEVSADEFDEVFNVNVSWVANFIRHFVPSMVVAKTGVVVGLSSYWGRSTSAGVAPYNASKFAVEGLMSALSKDFLKSAKGGQPGGTASIAVNPGVINTDMLQKIFGDNGARSNPGPEEWCESAAPFLLSLSGIDNGKSLTVPNF
jgi:NAD(P)-dependent dehydrogenase (short-subunit alcohol dehydrogenase family)